MDRISNLPEDIKSKILSFLPIKEAIQTSKLSTRWRYTWASISVLEIHDEYFSSLKLYENRSRLVKFVDVLFLLHQGHIRDFKLSTKQFFPDALDRWIVVLSRNGIQKINFELGSKRKYKLPLGFYACEEINFLSLSNCYIKLPQEFKGFEMLSVVKLENCSFSGPNIEKLILCCPVLKDLCLIKFREKISLKINAPKLEKLSIEGGFADLQLNTPNLVKACIDLESLSIGRVIKIGLNSNFLKVFGGLQNLKLVGIHQHFLPYLAQGFIPNRINFDYLKGIMMDIDLNNSKEVETILFLLQSSPNLEDLDIYVSGTSEGKNTSIIMCNTLLRHLKKVNIECFVFSSQVIEFARFILASSPVLENIQILKEKPDHEYMKYNTICNQVQKFPRASSNVQIQFGRNSPPLFKFV